MTAIITGDILTSRRLPAADWMPNLKTQLGHFGKSPKQWEIYRGDEFQIEVNPEDAFLTAVRIKAFLKTITLDARMSIGIGEKDYAADKITESNGSAFVRSGEMFERLRSEKIALAVNTADPTLDSELNLMLKLASALMGNWLQQSGEFVRTAIENPQLSQEGLGNLLGINQAAVSRRQTRSHYELIKEVDFYFRTKVKMITG